MSMTQKPPSVFIGSSGKAMSVAREVELQLQGATLPTIWKNDVFGLGAGTLEALLGALELYEFAVLVLTADDVVTTGDSSSPSPRDNVVFELGLFMGRNGRDRTFIVQEAAIGLKLPSDLLGITVATFTARPDDNLAAAISPAVTQILRAIRKATSTPKRASGVGIESFPDMGTAFQVFGERVASNKLQVSAAELMQHSSEQASGFVRQLAKAGANIELFLQHPRTAQQIAPGHTVPRIEYRISGHASALSAVRYKGDFRVYLYEAPASVDGVRLVTRDDNRILVLGWYAYFHTGPVKKLSDCQINGAEKPCIAINSKHPDFDSFNEFFDDLLNNHRSQSENRPAYRYPESEPTVRA